MRSAGNHQSGVNVISQVNGEHRFGIHLHLLAGWEKLSTKEQWMAPASTCVPGECCLDPCPSSPCLKARQLSSSQYVLGALWAAVPVLESRASEFVSEQVHVRAPQEESLRLQQPSILDTILAGHYGDSSSQYWCPRLWSPVWVWDPLLFTGDLHSQAIPSHS